MKKKMMIFAIALTMAACGTQSTKENAKEMNTLTFTTERPDGQPNQGSPLAALCLHGIPTFSECPWHFAEGVGTTQERRQNH